MKTITEEDVQKQIDDKSVVVLLWHADEDHCTKSLEYDFIFKSYTIHTRNGTMSTMDIKEAVHRYNTEDLTLREF